MSPVSTRISTGSYCALFILALCGCGADEGEPQVALSPTPTHTLIVTDSISGGSDDMEECMFGAIERTAILEDGSVVALDVARCCIFRFGADGAHIGTIGSAGPGPGEMGYPSDMTVLEDGSIAISDPMRAAVLLYSPDSGYTGKIDGFPMTPVSDMHPAPGGGFIGWRSSLEMGEEEYLTVIRVGRWTDDGEPGTVYWESSEPSDMSSFTAMLKQSLYSVEVTADRGGRVFVAPISTEEYTVLCFQPDGEMYATITMDLPQTPRSEIEMQAETYRMENRMRRMGDHGMPMVWEPDPFRVQVGGMGTDHAGRLWVRRGTEDQPFFDIFDPDSGERLFGVEMDHPGDASGWIFSIEPGGILAWSADAESCQSIYRLELVEHQ